LCVIQNSLKERTEMNRRFLLLIALMPLNSTFAPAQGLPPLGPPQEQKPPVQGLPPLNSPQDQKPAAQGPSGTLSVDAANADLKTARAANQEKRYADAETLMLRDTSARPNMPYLWIELGQAQLGEKKYADAETSFKAALTGGESIQKQAPAAGFYKEGKGTIAHVSVSTSAPPPDRKENAEIQGIVNSSLGEVYIHLARIPEAKEAFDKAASTFPAQAGLYLRNETILFLQTGNAVEQVIAADKAIAVDPTRAALYFYKGQGLAAQATIDQKTQKLILPAGCAEALQKYLDLEPAGPYASDAKGMLAAAGVAVKPAKK
jgi:tetratricopeptide (TPR) repeat protein